MKGRSILVDGQPLGKRFWGPISGTPLPGLIMMVTAATEPVVGDFQYQEASVGADGKKAVPYVLVEDRPQGRTVDDAYVSGTMGDIYVLLPGDDFNGRLGEGAGTSNTGAIGDPYMLDSDSGTLIPWTTGEVFAILMETITTVAASTLCYFRKT